MIFLSNLLNVMLIIEEKQLVIKDIFKLNNGQMDLDVL